MMKRLAALLLAACLGIGPVAAQTVAATTNSSAVITAGNTFQSVLAGITFTNSRRSLTIQNNNASDSCWLFIGPTASATKGTSILLTSAQPYIRYYPYIPSDNIAATCAATNDTLYVDTQ